MDFPKKQAQRLMPLYLLEYSEKLFENHPDPEAPWGGGGGDYTAGYGIDITNSEISVDTDVIATKSDITSMVTTTMLDDALDDYALKTDIPENVSDLNNDAGYTTQTWVENQGYSTFSGNYNDLTNKPTIPTATSQLTNDSNFIPSALGNTRAYSVYESVPLGGTWKRATYSTNGISFETESNTSWLGFPTGKTGIIALSTDIPYTTSQLINDSGYITNSALSGYATKTWVLDRGYITGITSSDVVTALGYTPGTSNFSGSYNDLTNKPDLSIYAESADLSTVATSGSYNDLSNKPTIPDAVSGTNDGTNWTTLTIGNSTYDIPQGGSTPGMIGEVIYSNTSGSTNLTLTMAHSFADYSYVDIQWINNDGLTNSTRIYEPNGKTVILLSANVISNGYFDKAGIYSLSGTAMTQVSKGQGAMVNNSSSIIDYKDNTQTSDYVKVTKVIGYKANSSALTTEQWTFTLQDGTTITKNIVTA